MYNYKTALSRYLTHFNALYAVADKHLQIANLWYFLRRSKQRAFVSITFFGFAMDTWLAYIKK